MEQSVNGSPSSKPLLLLSDFSRSLKKWLGYSGNQASDATIIYGGADSWAEEETQILSWRAAALLMTEDSQPAHHIEP
jgi:hypothetical protein